MNGSKESEGRRRRRALGVAGLILLVWFAGGAPAAAADAFVSTDFNMCVVPEGTGGWAFTDALGGVTRRIVGAGSGDAWLEIAVPAGPSRDPWHGNYVNTPRLTQEIVDGDFEIEVKFLSTVTLNTQLQGIVIEQDAGNWLRFDFHSKGAGLRLFAASTVNSVSTSRHNVAVSAGLPLYMRITRTGNQWTQRYSYNGTTWLNGASFTHAMSVARAGVFAANAGTSPPAHTARFDYAFNTASPIAPEDGGPVTSYTLNAGTSGTGTVTLDPAAASYACGTAVSLTATPGPGWAFSQWTGDASGSANPLSVTMDADTSITATFVELPPPAPPVISNIQVAPGHDSAVVTWTTDVASTSTVLYGLTSGYGSTTGGAGGEVTAHAVLVSGLSPDTTYHFQVTSETSGFSTSSADATFVTGSAPAEFSSDDFNACALNESPGFWTFHDPLGDSTQRIVGAATGEAYLEIAVPAGVAHDPWNAAYDAPRVMRALADADFELEVKFLSSFTAGNQLQGVLVEASPGNYLRFDFHRNGNSLRVFAASTVNHVSTSLLNRTVSSLPAYMRITRVGNQWTQRYSSNGTTWTIGATFTHAMAVTAAGVFAGNAGTAKPAHTARVDYVFNTASPIVPEDGGPVTSYTLNTGATGMGTVERSPNQATYPCGSAVSLTATAAPGWLFSGWSGDASGTANPIAVTMDADKSVSATFIEMAPPAAPVLSNIQLVPGHDSAMVTWTTDVASTSTVHYGPTSGYGNTAGSGSLVTAHAVLLTGLSPGSTYHFQVSSETGGFSTSSEDDTFVTLVGPAGFVSDDFNTCSLNEGTGFWTFHNPLGDSTQRIVGAGTGEAFLEIAVPAGVAHDPWNAAYSAPRVMRAIADVDFELEVKFLSGFTAGNQMQGLLIEQGPGNYLRFDFNRAGNALRVFAASTVDNVSTSRLNRSVATLPAYMRITRVGDHWTQRYSSDGVNWTLGVSFTHAMAVTAAGVFAGNGGTAKPAHTAQVDYLFNTAAPVAPEDGAAVTDSFTVTTFHTGNGSVGRDPDQPTYPCGTTVSISATPGPGWVFSGWSGDLISNENPLSIVVSKNRHLTANFHVNVPPTILNISAIPGDGFITVTWQTDEPANAAVDFGTTDAYELGTLTDANFATTHTITITGLTPSTTYHLRLTSADQLGASTSSPDQVASTLPEYPLSISNILVTPASTSVTVTWTTNKPSTGSVIYGETTAYEVGAVPSPTLKFNHLLVIGGLTAGKQYHYQVLATDGLGLEAHSGDRLFHTAANAPVMSIWYGGTQNFGHNGTPQVWVNILGHVFDPNGIQSLQYRLNGGPLKNLSRGPDNRRLGYAGDFNVDIPYADMTPGANEVRVIATDTLGNSSQKVVNVNVTTGMVWPLPYSVDWSTVAKIEDVAQVVDGLWSLDNGAVRAVMPEYDRILDIGDMTWTNYQVTVPITVHSLHPGGYASPSNGPAVGLGIRWNGHTVVDSAQPASGYVPLGALAWYRWLPNGTEQFQIYGNRNNKKKLDTSGRKLTLGETWYFKANVQTLANGNHRYRFRYWKTTDPEPSNWLEIQNGNLPDDPAHGSLLLLAHEVDATFGNVVVEPLP